MINVIIVDDEKLAIRKLEHQLETLEGFDINICGTYDNPAEALENLAASRPDLVFLDIEMPGMNGLETADRILELTPETDIVFVTAYDKYALDAFEVSAVDYLLKPVMRDRLAKTLSRVNSRTPVRRGDTSVGNEYSVKTFGGLDVVKNWKPMNVTWRSAKVRELFGYFVHHRGRRIYRNKILEELWPDMEYERALANFNTCNYQLRKQLSQTCSGIEILFSGGYYTFELRGSVCDADIVHDILSRNSAAAQSNIELIKKAIDLYKGPYCESIPSLWADSRRYYYENLYVNSVFSVANYFYDNKMYGECLTFAQKAVEQNQLFEEGWKLILEVLKLRGDKTGYNKKCAAMQKIFKKELGEAPT